MLHLFKMTKGRYLVPTVIAPLVFSSVVYANNMQRLDSSWVLQYINRLTLFETSVDELTTLDGMNENFSFNSNHKKYVLSRISNDLVDFNAFLQNYVAIANIMRLPKIIHADPERRIFVREYTVGEVFEPDQKDEDIIKAAEEVYTLHHLDLQLSSYLTAKDHIKTMLSRMNQNAIKFDVAQIHAMVDRVYDAISRVPFKKVPCHNDLNASNFLVGNSRVFVIDWEFASMNDPAWDLAYFMTISRMPEEKSKIFLESYQSKVSNDPTLVDRITAYKPITLVFLGTFFAYRNNPDFTELSSMCLQQAKELFESSNVQAAIKRLESIPPSNAAPRAKL